MASFFTRIGNALQPVGKGTLLPDGRVIYMPRRRPNDAGPEQECHRYVTPRQRVLLGWAKPLWAVILALFVTSLVAFGDRGKHLIDFGDARDVTGFVCFLVAWLLGAANFLVLINISAKVQDDQYYEAGD